MPQSRRQKLKDEFLRALKEILRKQDPQLLLVLLTQSEQVMVSRRIQVAKRLLAGWTIQEIRSDLAVGQATVEAVDRWLSQNFSEYRSVLSTLHKEMLERSREERRNRPVIPHTFRWLRRKYPLHFLLLNLLLDDLNFQRGDSEKQRKHPREPQGYCAPTSEEARQANL